MKSYKGNNFSQDLPCVVALGCFDGVHLGHREVIETAVRTAKERAIKSAVLTFDEPPRNLFKPAASPVITDYTEKQRAVRSLGIDIFISTPFNTEMSELSPVDFFKKLLIDRLNAVHVVCGFNYSFGKGGKGNVELLRELCLDRGVGFTCIPPVVLDGENVSSSAIRHAVREGNMQSAERYLGRPFAITIPVVNGQHLARKLGFPTVNQIFAENALIPMHGVYVTRVTISSKKHFGITNVGMRPTVNGTLLCSETHILDFEGDLYGKKLRVEFLKFMRPEIKFDSVDELSKRVHADIAQARSIIAKFNKKI